MSKLKGNKRKLYSGLFLTSLALWSSGTLQAQMVVKLTSFNTLFNSSSYKIEIRWQTESESDIAGFHIYRSTSSSLLGQRINSELIEAQGSPSRGASYFFIDEPPVTGRYYYQLAELSLSTGAQNYSRPSVDNDGEPDYDDFIKAFSDEEQVRYGEYYEFNEGTAQDPGDGHKVVLIVVTTGVSGTISVRQVNAAPVDAPNGYICPWRWEMNEDLGGYANIDFYYKASDIAGTPENKDYIGIAKWEENSKTWRWLGGTVYAADHKVRILNTIPTGTFALYRRIFGDITGNGYVDLSDFQRLGDVWGRTSTGEFPAGSDARFFNYNKNTVNGKQVIDLGDFQVFGDNWNKGTPK